jgi:hypothetical protein
MAMALQQAATTQRPASATNAQETSSPMALRTSLPSSPPPSQSSAVVNVDSPVMNETLSVINEHMNDMHGPNMPFANGLDRTVMTNSAVSTPQPLNRYSYIAGQETDEEEQEIHTEAEVMAWSPQRVAEYLEDQGVEKSHCDCFKEQEISGEVLLAMEQSSIFLKEFDLGSVGRRLKTWHKIRALQDEVRTSRPAGTARSTSEYSSVQDDTSSDATRNRASTVGSILPRALDTPRQSVAQPQRSTTLQVLSQAAAAPAPTRPEGMSPLQSMTSISRGENTYRPSAQIIREMQHSRRHSSMDSTTRSNEGGSRLSHRKQPSLDQKWQLGQLHTNGSSSSHIHTLSSDSTAPKRYSGIITTNSPDDLDRGYFSSNELDSRTTKRLTKRTSSTGVTPTHSRQASYNQRNRRSTQGQDGPGSLGHSTSGIFSGLNSIGSTLGSLRSVTAPTAQVKPSRQAQQDLSPVVTKLDHSDQSSGTSMGQVTRNDSATKGSSSPSSNKFQFFSAKPKVTGLRTISDAITRTEKQTASPTKDAIPFSLRTGSTTPSTETQSIDLQKSEAQSRTSNGSATNLVPPPSRQRRMKPKTKKSTSAYTRGLEKKSPGEQMITCDYSGWMKKKSGSLMTTWKPRLFILRGRRLSYYYSDQDTEEKGLIDISFHRVLPAHNETLTGIHATVTGAAATPTSPKDSVTPTAAQMDLADNPPPAGDDGTFIFKLVPPKTGLSKGVNFTRPTVHYFAVNSRQEGRLWMAALMKATIDRDEDGAVTTTYSQKTISLAKARARRERPPALREDENLEDVAELEGDDEKNKGLGIEGADEKAETIAGAEKEVPDGSSIGTNPIHTPAESTEKLDEKAAVAAAAAS